MVWIWQNILYAPLFNALIWLYEYGAAQNLGVAVIELTILLRISLLPLSIISERDSYHFDRVAPEIEQINEDLRHDPVQRKERIRELLKERRLHPWAKVWGIVVQGLVLVVLYRVFVNGINEAMGTLYSWVPHPAVVNSVFLGQEIGERSVVWAAFVGFVLFFSIHIDQRRSPGNVTRNDVIFSLFFPFFTFLILWYLPSVKALFIVTSVSFSYSIAIVRRIIFPVRQSELAVDKSL